MIARFAIALYLIFAAAPAFAQDARAGAAYAALSEGRYEDALREAETLSQSGNAEGDAILAYLHENGLGVDRDLQHAVDLYTKAARAGQPDAQFALGELAMFGDGVERSAETAAGWYKLAARQGHARAKLRLGVMHAEGDGMEKDQRRAIDLFREAAEGGEPEAARNLAIAYLSGDGVVRDYRTAADWFEKAADQGDPVASYNLGLLLQSGTLAPPDIDKAAARMRAAAEAGFAPAMVGLGLLIHDGATSDELPSDWFARAAEAGDAQGRFLYAVALAEGDGRDVDIDAAIAQLDALLEEPAEPDLIQQARSLRKDLERRKKGGRFGFGKKEN